MEKRLILAFVLSFVVLYGYQAFFSPPPEPGANPATTIQNPQPPVAPPVSATSAPAERITAAAPAPKEDVLAEKAEEFVVETALYTATVSNAGGVLKSYKLKAYADAEGGPIELISELGGTKLGWPLAIETGDAALDETLSEANYLTQAQGERLSMEFAANGVHARKILEFNREKFEFSIRTTLTRDGKSFPHSVVWQGGFGDQSIAHDPAKKNAIYQVEAAFTRAGLAGIDEPVIVTTPRAGAEDQYFLSMFLVPDNPGLVKVQKEEYPGTDGNPVRELHVSAAMPDAKDVRVYVGPKDQQWLSKADPLLPGVIDYGWFQVLAKPLFYLLMLIHSYIGNFGWAIIILTLAINLLLFPLRLKQQIAMQKMQKIQPQMRTLQDKYKKLKANDPRRAQVQTEMMGLYKVHGVNPMGGCLPLLLQMPVFFALYNALYVSIELRRAPWLWVPDLSQPDWLFGFLPVLPILFAVSMVVMTKMSPTTVDPAQAKIMMFMPLVFAFMFVNVQSGLSLYWVTGNVVGIGQQVLINKYWSPQVESKPSSRSKPKESPDK